MALRDVLLVVDVVDDFTHEDGDRLLAAFESARSTICTAIATARDAEVPIVYVNDTKGEWHGERSRLVRNAIERGRGGHVVEALQPRDDDLFVVKPRYSAFDVTPLELLLDELDAERIVLVGGTTEMCVTQTAVDARERGLKVTVLEDACADPALAQTALAYLRDVTGTFVHHTAAWTPGADEPAA